MVTYGAIINIKVEKERFYTWLEKDWANNQFRKWRQTYCSKKFTAVFLVAFRAIACRI